jgi:plasmid stabilization system protein ParE
MRVIVLPSAEADIEAIGDYIAQDNPARALDFVRELRIQVEGLGMFPLGHPRVRGFESAEVRYSVFGRYLLFFRVSTDDSGEAVHLLRVLHKARDYLDLLEF